MRYQYAIYVPSTTNIDQPVNNEQIVKRIAKLFSLRFGGASWEQINGAWFSTELDDLVIESVTRVWAFCDDNSAYNRAFVKMLSNAVKTWMTQESVAYEIIEHTPESGLMFA